MNYTPHFVDVVEYCKDNKLFIGYGNPSAKVLVIGKEKSNDDLESIDTIAGIKQIVENSNKGNQINIDGWIDVISSDVLADWDNMPVNKLSSLYSSGSQFNKGNRETKNGWNNGTSGTYLKYQKLKEFLLKEKRSEKINFQKHFFLTEFSDISTKMSYTKKEIKKLRATSIAKRKELLKMAFFKSFPITIVAAGSYPKDYEIDLEDIFDVKYVGETQFIGEHWYNVHISTDSKRILIHTRQLSGAITDDLLLGISQQCSSFLGF